MKSLSFIELLFSALIFIFPAYCTNAAPVIFGGGKPIDHGKLFLDGKHVFGPNKTVRGTVAGLTSGILATIALHFLLSYDLLVGLALSIGALVGDLTGSFIKRRFNFPPGKPLLIVDQLTFIIF
ncbi:MAG: CDP-archaeol synthase, partial [Candidatus Bathyarchaeia archaeon]